MGLTTEKPGTEAKELRSTVEAWKAELGALRHDPTVRRFIDLQDKIDASEALDNEDALTSPPVSTGPYDLYDLFEFARDLAGQRMSSHHVTQVARRRFPETSNAGRQVMLHFLVDNGYAKVIRRTAAGPATYRFTPPSEGSRDGRWSGLVLPTNELSRFKAADLDDLGEFPPAGTERTWRRE
jgi:hypothetical protein